MYPLGYKGAVYCNEDRLLFCLNGKHKCGLMFCFMPHWVAEGVIYGSMFSSRAHHKKLKICCLTISYCLTFRKFGT
jgi:hypothetical protein